MSQNLCTLNVYVEHKREENSNITRRTKEWRYYGGNTHVAKHCVLIMNVLSRFQEPGRAKNNQSIYYDIF